MSGDDQMSFDKRRPVVIKLGSSTLTSDSGDLDEAEVRRLVREFAAVKKSGYPVVVVSSGAIAAGKKILNYASRPKNVEELQALAAVGQVELLRHYRQLFEEESLRIAQILLTAAEMTSRISYLNARNTIAKLLELDIVPIVNENDTVAIDELRFGDNDTLSAMVAVLTDASILINLSDTPGLFTDDPRRRDDARMIERVTEITPDLEMIAAGPGTEDGSGGMATKIQAAEIATSAQIPMVIADGSRKDAVSEILDGKAVGTFFEPSARKLSGRKSWIAFGKSSKGSVIVDAGAVDAMINKGSSLLPAGIVAIEGFFQPADAVEILDVAGNRFAKGITNYSSEELDKIKGAKTSELNALIGDDASDEVIHRDELVIIKPAG